MCGICGEIQFNGATASIKPVEKMLQSMKTRGPDGRGLFQMSGVCLGHQRLKIIDLSDRAHQPMVDNELGLVLSFNGCIYNYRELRQELEKKNYRFFSLSDTEVILKAYHHWGIDFLSHLSGMFAFVLLERDSGKLILARDRLGIKPLYYTEVPNGFRFASTLPALLSTSGIDASIDPEALNFYMSFHSVVPPPMTILKGVRKLPPGCYMEIQPNAAIRILPYWNVKFEHSKQDQKLSQVDWMQELKITLKRAVERRTIADVPFGVLLSGGLDSSLLVGLLSELGHQNINSFSIGFESLDEEEGDEFKYSDLIAKRFQTKHHKILVPAKDLLSHLEDCVRSMSEPMTSHDNIGFYLLSKKVSKHVKVVQSGQGADEIFAGYHWYPPMMTSQNAFEDYRKLFFDRDQNEMNEALEESYRTEDISGEFVRRHFEQNGAKTPIDKALRLDTEVMLVDDPVKRVDNMTMRWSLEARVPFLDHELVELAARIPPQLKVNQGGKFIVKEVARSIIPEDVIDRPKGYFPVPQLKYIRGESLDFVKDVWNHPTAKSRGVFKKAYVEKLLKDPESHISPLRGSKLWQVTLLEYWLQCQGL